MATTYKILGQSAPAATTNTALYTVPSATSAVASTLVICNTNASAVTVRVYARIAGAAAATGNAIIYDAVVLGNQTATFTLGMTLATTDVITVYASTTAVAFTLFGSEIV